MEGSMPRFYYQDQAVYPADTATCVEAARRALTEMGAKPYVAGQRLTGKLGTQLGMRIVGGAFCPAKWLPIEIVVDVVDGGASRQVVVNVADRLGVGVMLGMEQKYRGHCQQTATWIRDRVTAVLASASAGVTQG
jgi:hypothetical protein